VLAEDPAAPVIQRSVSPPLPEILEDEEIERALGVTQGMWSAAKPDPRPHLLINLLLDTGMKKAECMGIQLGHIDRYTAEQPFVQIRYESPAKKAKERKLTLSDETMRALDAYLERYAPKEALFPCTPRNLEYVLSDVAEKAEITKKAKKGISFEMLRWTSAVRDYREGMDPVRLRQKLGISQVTWQETRKKIEALLSEEPEAEPESA
jgi:integrase/recombinase XerD